MIKILVVGSGAREHALARALMRSPQDKAIYGYFSHANPDLMTLVKDYVINDLSVGSAIVAYAQQQQIDFAIIGPEAPLAAGVVDQLKAVGIPAIGPTKALAQIETSKGFTRELLTRSQVAGQIRYRHFQELSGFKAYLTELDQQYVVKADGLMGGKGVKIAGEHLQNADEAYQFATEILAAQQTVVVEEKLVGQEFSLLSFSDGKHSKHMPLVQDHKRAFDGDQGPNTGGMGCYTDHNHRLPFVSAAEVAEAAAINEACIAALYKETGEYYCGVLYGGFMQTKHGIKLLEYNARFGDPEAINLLGLLETDFIAICLAMIKQTLNDLPVQFAKLASVCKYVVPNGYPDHPLKNQKIDVSAVTNPDALYYASVDQRTDGLYLLGSRAVALLALAPSITAAEASLQTDLAQIQGPVFYRKDIGTAGLINQRIQSVNALLHTDYPALS